MTVLRDDKFQYYYLNLTHLGGSLIQQDLGVRQLLSWDVAAQDRWAEIQERPPATRTLPRFMLDLLFSFNYRASIYQSVIQLSAVVWHSQF